MEREVERFCYFGHKGAILDLATSCLSDTPVIVTTSDDLTIRLWNPLSLSPHAMKCYCGFGQESIDSLLFHPTQSHLFLGATNSAILQFDLNSPGIITRDHVPLFNLPTGSSDITCFTIHPTDHNLLVVSDDDGVIYLFDFQSQTITKRLTRVHSNLLGKISFNPMNPNILISGGFDSICCAWDIRRGRPCSNTSLVNFTDLNQSHESNLQIANPPFVHDLLHILHGRIVVCALGDGNLSLYKTSDGSLLSVSHMIEAHSGMVTNLSSYPKQQNNDLEKGDYFMSAGADGLIKIWEVREILTDGLPPQGAGKKNKKKSKQSRKEWYEVIERRVISHPNKINSIASVATMVIAVPSGDGSEGPLPAIAVCDVTSEWFLYR
jgi:WD40 repeat protein